MNPWWVGNPVLNLLRCITLVPPCRGSEGTVLAGLTNTLAGLRASHTGLGDLLSSRAARCTKHKHIVMPSGMRSAEEQAVFHSNAALILELIWGNYPQVINQP